MTNRYVGCRALRVEADAGVVTLTIANPPMNSLTAALLEDLDRVTAEVAADPQASVVVLRSADPEIFVTHAEFANLYRLQPPAVPTSVDEVTLNSVHEICERLRSMEAITIAQVEGRTAGGGAALVMACDLRFGAIGGAVFNTMAVPLGTVPGGGASQYLPRLVGRARALELILGGLDLDAVTAASWGYLNRALPADEIGAYVPWLARRIAACPRDAVRRTVALVDRIGPVEDGLREENFHFRQLMASAESRDAVAAFLARGGETREGELRIEHVLGEVLDRPHD
jgi:enoyl-CoA hydratase/carnithine racemase